MIGGGFKEWPNVYGVTVIILCICTWVPVIEKTEWKKPNCREGPASNSDRTDGRKRYSCYFQTYNNNNNNNVVIDTIKFFNQKIYRKTSSRALRNIRSMITTRIGRNVFADTPPTLDAISQWYASSRGYGFHSVS